MAEFVALHTNMATNKKRLGLNIISILQYSNITVFVISDTIVDGYSIEVATDVLVELYLSGLAILDWALIDSVHLEMHHDHDGLQFETTCSDLKKVVRFKLYGFDVGDFELGVPVGDVAKTKIDLVSLINELNAHHDLTVKTMNIEILLNTNLLT